MPAPLARLAMFAVPAVLLTSLTACRAVNTAAPSPAVAGSAKDAGTVAADTGSAAAAAPGSLSITMSSPVSESGTTGASVTCARTAVLYLASADNALVSGYDHSFTVRIVRYRGPGTYRAALITLTVTGPHGGIASSTGLLLTPVTVTNSGGAFTIDRTGADGRELDATVSWTCP
jgi:hypothetical protein